MRSMIWSAVLVHLKGRAVSFQSLIQSSSAVMSSSREQDTPRSGQRRCSSASHRSTWLIHDELAVLAPSLYDDPAAELHEDASAGLREHPALLGCSILRRSSADVRREPLPGSRWRPQGWRYTGRGAW
jgi:hypothetical protein